MGERLVSDLLSAFARDWHLFVPIGVIGSLSWSIWLIRKLLSNRYRSVVNDYRTTTSVIVPSFREDPDVLERCLDTWLAQRPPRSSWSSTCRTGRPSGGSRSGGSRG
jgi:cellulose synthase/poly-beta-1,6-N-acetylglucosamine synthase-like glycosyltransferase